MQRFYKEEDEEEREEGSGVLSVWCVCLGWAGVKQLFISYMLKIYL